VKAALIMLGCLLAGAVAGVLAAVGLVLYGQKMMEANET
jgi:hypothetical protein